MDRAALVASAKRIVVLVDIAGGPKGDPTSYQILKDYIALTEQEGRSCRTPRPEGGTPPAGGDVREALPMFANERLPDIALRLRRLAEIASIVHMAEASMALGDANYLDDLAAALLSPTGGNDSEVAPLAQALTLAADPGKRKMDGAARQSKNSVRGTSQ